jgi:hypothetical protein
MRRLLSLFIVLITTLLSWPAVADHLDGVAPLVKDDLAALAQIKTMPNRHVMLYFGDHVN